MRAAFLTGAERIDVGEWRPADPGPGEVRITVEACGICGSNLHAWRHPSRAITSNDGAEPGAAGHEVAGRLDDGTLVVVEPNLTGACGDCSACTAGTAWFCRSKTHLGSWGFADEMVVPAASVFRVPAGIEPATATLTEPLACAVHALRWSYSGTVGSLEGATVAVLGSGVAGLLVQVAARALGAGAVIASAAYPHQAAMATRLGADEVVDARSDDAVDVLRNARPTIVVEAVGGNAPTFGDAMRIVATSGEVVVLGLFDEPQTFDARRAVFRETRMFFPVTYGTRDAEHDYDVALRILKRRNADVAPLITHRFDLDDVAAAFGAAADKTTGGLRVVVEP